jgi:hypothetical protein
LADTMRRIEETRAAAVDRAGPVESNVIGKAVERPNKADAGMKSPEADASGSARARTGGGYPCAVVGRQSRQESAIVLSVSTCEPRHDPTRLPRRGRGSHVMIEGVHYSPSLPSSSA